MMSRISPSEREGEGGQKEGMEPHVIDHKARSQYDAVFSIVRMVQ